MSHSVAGWRWLYKILPYVGQKNVYHLGNDTNDSASNVAVSDNVIEVDYCPSRRAAKKHNDLPKADYAGNAGEQGGSFQTGGK